MLFFVNRQCESLSIDNFTLLQMYKVGNVFKTLENITKKWMLAQVFMPNTIFRGFNIDRYNTEKCRLLLFFDRHRSTTEGKFLPMSLPKNRVWAMFWAMFS